ncbi:unnamed protein product [Lymnaea stagnalis]|uniref:G-protein coupled receptors family 1 profile domain-containing protein n=1 Tax=Lymnaea stagnalis TaxID=6523 RepID=A0AAV2HT38_LYMST
MSEKDLLPDMSIFIKTTDSMEVMVFQEGEKTALVAVISFMAIIIALGSIGNILVTLAVLQTKKLQTVSNLFVANLSVCDLLFVTVVLPVNMYTYLMEGWQLNDYICKFIGFLGYTLTGTTIMTITLIAWNRYKLVVDVSRYKQLFRKWNIVIMVAATWVVPVLFLQPAVFGAWGHFGYIPMLSSCNLGLDNSSQTFKIFLLIVRAAIPCGLIIFYYSAIYITTRASHQRLHISTTSNYMMRQNNHRREMRLTRMMIAIFVVFVLSYFPCTISSVIDWSRILSKTFHMFCQTSVFLGSAINPLLYGFMNEQFRCAYYQILTCRVMVRGCKGKKKHMHQAEAAEKKENKAHCKTHKDHFYVKSEDSIASSSTSRKDSTWENSDSDGLPKSGTCSSNTSTKGIVPSQSQCDPKDGLNKVITFEGIEHTQASV